MPIPAVVWELSRQGWARVAGAICWERTNETVVCFEAWPAHKKDDLTRALNRVLAGQTLGLPAAPALAVNFQTVRLRRGACRQELRSGTS
jgi:hypothetical protein